ncbi:hypothetical protein C2G38_2219602, partial [Gigaspora rosea]
MKPKSKKDETAKRQFQKIHETASTTLYGKLVVKVQLHGKKRRHYKKVKQKQKEKLKTTESNIEKGSKSSNSQEGKTKKEQLFEVPMEEFNAEWWPLVTNVWMKFNYRNHVNGNSWKTFVCRFNKPFKSSTRKEDVPSEKRRKTKVQDANLCSTKIKVTWLVTEKKVHVERIPSSLDHTHDLEESERLKRSQAVRALVEKEAVKNYPAPAIVNAVK